MLRTGLIAGYGTSWKQR